MIQLVETEQNQFLETKNQAERKALGQFFTSSSVATFMAEMITCVPQGEVRILDAGAGAGILSYAAAMRCRELGSTSITIVAYEVDHLVLTELENTMIKLGERLSDHGVEFLYEIRNIDFVLDRPDLRGEQFDVASINPPYFKYRSKDSKYAGVTADLFAGNPNIYASFMAIVGASLSPLGQMIAIVPRSFTNGLYFKGFRQYLNRTLYLDHLHIFRSRNMLFKDLAVLQENIICKYIRSREYTDCVKVSRSPDAADLENLAISEYQPTFIVDDSRDHFMIRIPESDEEAQILEEAGNWSSSFSDNGYFISTGPVVEFRAKDFISSPDDANRGNRVPLIRMHNCKQYKFTWSGEHIKDVQFRLVEGFEKHTIANKAYMLLKRFSSKDEKRRLTATAYFPHQIVADEIAVENHLNYVGHKEDDLSEEEQLGLCVLFNSTRMDKYFRCISGNTQVNASEVRVLKMPSRAVILEIGRECVGEEAPTQAQTDEILNKYLKDF